MVFRGASKPKNDDGKVKTKAKKKKYITCDDWLFAGGT